MMGLHLRDTVLYGTTKELVDENAFRIVIWVGFGLCMLAVVLRSAIRLACFRKLLIEDCLMLLALAILIAIVAVLQKWLSDIYTLIHVENGISAPGPDFLNQLPAALRADGIVVVLSNIGLWTIKLNFLTFFYRLGHQIRTYRICWWVALVLVVSCGLTVLGLVPYSCMFGSLSHIVVQCATESNVSYIYTVFKASVVIDVLSDVIIICFPIIVLWQTRITLRQKLVLSSIFSLVGFTIAVTIVRGSIFGGVYKSVSEVDRKVMDVAWMLFWQFIQYIVSFMIACLISFRSLWTGKGEKARQRKMEEEKQQRLLNAQLSPDQAATLSGRQQSRGSQAKKWQRMYDSLLDTLHDLEGTTLERGDSNYVEMDLPGSRMTDDFSKWDMSHATATSSIKAPSQDAMLQK